MQARNSGNLLSLLSFKYIDEYGEVTKQATYNSTNGPRRKNERGVKWVRVLAVVGTTMSKRVRDAGVL